MKLYRSYLIFAIAIAFFNSCGNLDSKSYEKVGEGILIKLKNNDDHGPNYVKLSVINDKIVQVSSSRDAIGEISSLMVIGKQPKVDDWKFEEEGQYVVLTTNSLQVKVSKLGGEVSFYDLKGSEIIKEINNAKQFVPAQFGEEKSYALHKEFYGVEDEAFYGLGQHQTGLMNYKGYQVDLTQYNGVAIVPFVVSSRNYGILWDNNSISKFGDTREYQPISDLKLYSKDGEAGWLTATYNSEDAKVKQVVRLEKKIDYEFLPLKNLPSGYSLGKGTVTWEGFFESSENGDHTFSMPSSGYVKVWIDGQLLIDRWRECWNPGPTVFKYSLISGKQHPVKIEWIPEAKEAFLALRFLPPLEDKKKFAFTSEAGDIMNYYFVYGDDTDEVISGYRQLTGKAQIMPKWAMGFWQSRERYKTGEEIISTIQEFRKRKIPIDNIVLDWSYWKEDEWGSQDFDPERFPDPSGMIKELKTKYNAHFMISVWPKFYEGIPNYNILNEKGLLYTQNIINKQKDWIGSGYISTFYDAFHPEARKIFWDMLNEHLFRKGVDAWWLDATEPDIYSNASIAHRKALMNPTFLGQSDKFFNAYSLMNAKGIYEGQRAADPDKRVFILTRSAFGGLQRYGAATWSGDISSRFDEMKKQIPAGLNFGLSGMPYWTTDIGGFFVEDKYDRPNPKGEALEEWRELNTRWYQYGTFTPLYRAHGQYPYREVFNIAPENHKAYQSIVYYSKLRYRLMPYIYSLTGKIYHDDYTLMRALVMDFGKDPQVLNIADQFMFGPSILVNPVVEYKARQRKVYLPGVRQGWYDMYTGRYFIGGQNIVADAPYERMPMFVKAGSIIPFGPEIQYTTEKPAETIILYVYGGQNAMFELYEDENTNYNYEEGKYAIVPFYYDENLKMLTIGDRKGDFQGMLKERVFHIVYVEPTTAKPMDFIRNPDHVISYNGSAVSVQL